VNKRKNARAICPLPPPCGCCWCCAKLGLPTRCVYTQGGILTGAPCLRLRCVLSPGSATRSHSRALTHPLTHPLVAGACHIFSMHISYVQPACTRMPATALSESTATRHWPATSAQTASSSRTRSAAARAPSAAATPPCSAWYVCESVRV
jgi:hypothetical protein